MPAHAWLMAPVIAAYLLAAGFYFAEVFFQREASAARGRWLLIGAAALQGVALVGHSVASPQFFNVLETSTIVVWLVVVAFLLLERRARMTAGGVFVTPLAFLISVSMLGLPAGRAPQDLDKRWLWPHLGALVLGITTLGLAVCCALVYLTSEHVLKSKHGVRALRHFPSLDTADRLVVGLTAFGLSMLTAGIATGVLWSYALARPAPWTEPRTLLSLGAWLLFATYLFVRQVVGWQGSRAKWVIVAGFGLLVLTMIGYRVAA